MLHLSVISLALLLAALVALALILRRANLPGLSPGRRPRPRHRIVRIICGVLGVGILVAVAVGTVLSARSCYEPPTPPSPVTVRVPAKPAPAPRMRDRELSWPVVEKTRLLVDLVALDVSSGEPRALAAKSFDVEWPRDSGKRLRHVFTTDDATIEAAVGILSLTARRETDNATVTLDPRGFWEVRRSGRWGRGGAASSSGHGEFVWRLRHNTPTLARTMPPFSVASRIVGEPVVYCFVTPAAGDDPLRETALADFIDARREEIARLGRDGDSGSLRISRSVLNDHVPARGFLLTAHIGVSSLLLFVAAILLTQVFTNRALVYPAILAGVILYVAALDRTALGMHLARLDDASAAPAMRRIACLQATETFFCGKTALARIEAVAKDDASPKDLKDLAAEAAKRMRTRM